MSDPGVTPSRRAAPRAIAIAVAMALGLGVSGFAGCGGGETTTVGASTGSRRLKQIEDVPTKRAGAGKSPVAPPRAGGRVKL